MNISAPFIRRPVGTILLTLGLGLAGIAAFFALPVAPLPRVDFPAVIVQANLPGASPSTMATTVAEPLERHLGVIAGVSEMTSQSRLGSTQIVLIFDLSRNIDGAARDVQAAIAAARVDLPTTLKTNPTYFKINPADAPILILALSSATRSPDQIYDSVANIVQQKLLQVTGVGNVELGGAALPSVRVEIDPLRLSSYGIALEDVRTALQSASADRPRGVFDPEVWGAGEGTGQDTGQGKAWQIYSGNAGRYAADFAPLIIAWRNGAPVRLSDIAHVIDAPEDVRVSGFVNGYKAVPVIISRQPAANIVATVDGLKAQLPDLQRLLPADIKLEVVADRTLTIRASLHEVEVTLLIATLLVVLVVSLFLQSWRATLIPASAVIISLLGTLGVMYLAGFLIDNLSLMALTVATGFVVDDAIVVVENTARHVEDGMAPFAAALKGAREVGFTVLSISVSLVAVFVPLIFMGGIIGRLFREFALTMTAAVMISLLISLTTTPMLCAKLLRYDAGTQGWVFRTARRGLDGLLARYTRSLDWALMHRGAVGLLLGGAVVLNVYLIVIAPKGLFPEQDTSALRGGVRVDQSMSFADVSGKLLAIERIIKADPAVATVVAFTGGSRAGAGFLFSTLKPRSQRPGVEAVIARLRPKLARVRGISLFLNPVQDLQAGGRQTNATNQYVLEADTVPALTAAADKVYRALKAMPAVVTDVDVDQQDAGAEAFVTIDRDAAQRLGIPMTTIDNTLYDAFGQRQVAVIHAGLNQYHIVMEAGPSFTHQPQSLDALYLPTGPGTPPPIATSSANTALGANAALGSAVTTSAETLTPLGAVAHWAPASANASISHSDGEPSATVSFNLPPGVSLGVAEAAIVAAVAKLHLPATVHGDFGGNAKVASQSLGSIPLLILAAILAIYMVLGILYESAIHPLTVLSTLPSAGVGAIFALIVAGGQFDVIAMIGIILLIGVVKKNAILIIDFALDAERSRGLSPYEAIREASLLRFRPILMTTFAAALGALPLAIGFGEGAELRRPLGIAIVGGLVASQFLTLLTTPVVFLALDTWRRVWNRLSVKQSWMFAGLIGLTMLVAIVAGVIAGRASGNGWVVLAAMVLAAALAIHGLARLLRRWGVLAPPDPPAPGGAAPYSEALA